MKYRKKPVVIEAFVTDEPMDIETLEGTMHASPGDYIITGVNGEQYPCKPDIFEKTYEPADAAPSPVDRDALLALADEMDGLGLSGFSSGWSCGSVNVGSFARRIREALGVEDYAGHNDEPAQRQAMEAEAVQQRPMPHHREVPVGKG